MSTGADTTILSSSTNLPAPSRSWNTPTPSNGGLPVDDVSAPSLSACKALARFEFESNCGNEGTKILMVEWEDDDETRGVKGEWHISWKNDGKEPAVLPVDDNKSNDMHRLYFMIPPGSAVPPSLNLEFLPVDATVEPVVWKTTPLPAIFPPELGSSAKEKGKKGVLHTIWAKKRLSVLQSEIETETNNNPEGIGLEMALAEKEWIETNFGVVPKQRPSLSLALGDAQAVRSPSLSSPRSPGGGRLLEKMKGVRLGTKDEPATKHGSQLEPPGFANPLSPQESDMAMSSFASIKGTTDSNPGKVGGPVAGRRIAPQGPPDAILAQQQATTGTTSLGGVALSNVSFTTPIDSEQEKHEPSEADEEGLFALPISPRSAETTSSAFSFDARDTEKYSSKGRN